MQMKLAEAMSKTAIVNMGLPARCVKRRDGRGRLWYLIGVREKLFLVRQDRQGFDQVSRQFASKWIDWVPQSPDDADRETAILSTPGGLHFRNTVLGLVLGPIPKDLKAPDYFPDEF